MSHTAFGYDSEEDRLWLLYDYEHPRIWITRRIAQAIAGSVTSLVEQTATGFSDSSAKRVHMEHRLAVTETPDGQAHYPYKIQVESHDDLHEQGFTLCRGLSAHIHPGGGQIILGTDESEVKFEFNRYDLHLWLRALRMALNDADWALNPSFPAWLEEPLLPSAIHNLLTQPLPTDLDLEDESNQPGSSASPSPSPPSPPDDPPKP
jgi:hypothetical protein